MSRTWLRRAVLAAISASSLLLAACGSSTIESQLAPARIVSFGDAFSDLGQNGSRYTVNTTGITNWTEQVATSFGLTLTKSSTGGTGYAYANARVTAKPDGVGNSATPTVKEQVDAFLATGVPGQNDLFLLEGGYGDLVAEVAAVTAGTQTAAQMASNMRQAGRDMGAQARRLVEAGAKYVVIVGPYNLSKSPWATATGQASLLEDAAGKFNEGLLVSVVDLGANVLYVDSALHFNLVVATPSYYGLTDATTLVCTSTDAGVGIGTGTGQVNSALCTTSTLQTGVDFSRYLFADRIYPTPIGHQLFGTYAYGRIRSRW